MIDWATVDYTPLTDGITDMATSSFPVLLGVFAGLFAIFVLPKLIRKYAKG